MKKINFTKMAGAGNDFLVLESAVKGMNLKRLAANACNRTNGIGADGLLVLDKSKGADYQMRIINADGSEAEMCGNGARCMAAYIVKHRRPKKKLFAMETLAGVVLAEAKGEEANVRLSDPVDYRPDVSIDVNGRRLHISYIDTGVPHTIVFVDDLKKIDVASIGRVIRYHEAFKPRGTNVDFVEQISDDLVDCRTYERGVEDETRACGTGSVAAALISFLKSNPSVLNVKKAKMNVRTKSGEILKVMFDISDGKISNVWLRGSAKFIGKGEYYYV
jgi:diaminopimelate epimerase